MRKHLDTKAIKERGAQLQASFERNFSLDATAHMELSFTLSTCHITEEDDAIMRAAFEDVCAGGPTIIAHGFLVEMGSPLQIGYIDFDRDAQVHDSLPKFVW